jgi:regulator of nucleoside diphosphate kinase
MFLSTEVISSSDREALLRAVDRALRSWVTYAPYLDYFRRMLRRSHALPVAEVPHDMITMNSRFALCEKRTGETSCYTLVYPDEEVIRHRHVSVLSPMGVALYGAKVGEEVCWISTEGPRAATVKRLLYQPEAAGHENN